MRILIHNKINRYIWINNYWFHLKSDCHVLLLKCHFQRCNMLRNYQRLWLVKATCHHNEITKNLESLSAWGVGARLRRTGPSRTGTLLVRFGHFFWKTPRTAPNRSVRSGSRPYSPKSDGMIGSVSNRYRTVPTSFTWKKLEGGRGRRVFKWLRYIRVLWEVSENSRSVWRSQRNRWDLQKIRKKKKKLRQIAGVVRGEADLWPEVRQWVIFLVNIFFYFC